MTSAALEQAVKPPSRLRTWAKRLGIVGFAFFAVKGLVWLVVAAGVAWGAWGARK